MPGPEFTYFDQLKQEVAATFRKAFPYVTKPIEEWKGQEIADFQEELLKKVKGQISEKWFYTHIKSGNDKLPRIDMLNMLSQYAGYHSWNEFISTRNGDTKEEPLSTGGPAITSTRPRKKKTGWIIVILFVAATAAIIPGILIKAPSHTFSGCLVDLTGTVPAGAGKIEILLFKDNESPLVINCDSSGCFRIVSDEKKIRFIVRSPYYNSDTIVRALTELNMKEKIRVRTNDYALMIHYFSTSGVSDWKKRRMQLDDMIQEDARIYQVFDNSMGLEIYNKDEFINRMTMPLKSLKNVEIIETAYVNDRIKMLKFKLGSE